MKRTTLYLPKDLARKLKMYSAEHEEGMSEIMVKALERYLPT